MKSAVSVFAFALMLSGSTAVAAEEIPFQVRVAPMEAKVAPVVGIPAPNLAVVIRNDTSDKAAGVIPPRALVLRGVEWVSGSKDARRWNGSVVGAAKENADHTFSLNPNVARLTEQWFERGLLLPGDEITVNVPITPQNEEPPVLKITYAWAGAASQWGESVLLPIDGDGGTTHFVPATADRVAARHNRGGLGALRATLAADAAPVAAQTFTVPVQLPLALNPDYQLTGGISIIEATWKSGADKLPGPRHGVYCAPLRTWFFAASDGRAVAYERVPVEHPPLPPTAPPGFVPKPWKWTVRELPAVGHPFALDEFGRGEDGSTAIILDAATFGDLLDVPKQEQKLYDQRSETAVPAGKLWAVLARAREKNMSLVCYAVTPPAGEPRPQLQFLRTTGKAP